MTPEADQGDLTPGVWLGGKVRLLAAPRFDDARGTLVPFEFDDLPFVPRRLFTVHDVPEGRTRGHHALLSQTQLLICVAGRIDVQIRLEPQSETITLDNPHTGLLIEPGVWSSLRYHTRESVLLALASGRFDPTDYTTGPARRGE